MRSTPPADPLSCEIGQLQGLWLSLRCAKGSATDYPLKLMAREFHPWITLRSVLPRLRCECCRKPPLSVVLAETPYDSGEGMAGADPGWKIPLVGLPAGGKGG